MRKKLSALIFLVFLIVTPAKASAQNEATDGGNTPSVSPTPEIYKIEGKFDEYYKTYLSKIEEYQSVHQEYIYRKSQYQRYATLKSQQDAFEATAKMLAARDEVIISYLYCLKARLMEARGVTQERVDALNIRIDDAIGWFKDNQATIPSAGALNDLAVDSNEASIYWNKTFPVIYEVLSVIPYGENLDFAKRVDESFLKTKSKLEEVRNDTREGYSFSQEKFQILDRWVFEIDNKIARSKEKQTQSGVMIDQLIVLKKDYLQSYNRIITVVGESQLYLKEASTYLREIINELKKSEE